MDGFDLLKQAFNKFANKFDVEDLSVRALRSAAAGGKAAIEKGMEEFPQAFIKGMVEDLYALVTSQDVADGISMAVRSFDEEKVKEMLDGVVGQLKQDEVANNLAKQLKEILSKTSDEDLENAIDALLDDRSLSERMLAKAFFSQVRPILSDMRNGTEEEIAEKIKELADTIPTDIIAMQVGALTQEITPDRVAKQAHDVVGKMPSPAVVSDIAHSIGKSASAKFGLAAQAKSREDAMSALRELSSDAVSIIQSKIANDQAGKNKFGKGGGDFKFG